MCCLVQGCNNKQKSETDERFCKYHTSLPVIEQSEWHNTLMTNARKYTGKLSKAWFLKPLIPNEKYQEINIFEYVFESALYMTNFKKQYRANKTEGINGVRYSEYHQIWKNTCSLLFPGFDYSDVKDLDANIRQHFKFLGLGSLQGVFNANKIRANYEAFCEGTKRPLWVCRNLYDHNHENNYTWVNKKENWLWEPVDSSTPGRYKAPRVSVEDLEPVREARKGGRRGVCVNKGNAILKYF